LRWRTIALAIWGLALLLSVPAQARSAHGGNCVAYAREVTGIQLEGDAAAWWPHAVGRYERGQQPKVGAILVFKPSSHMHVGHVAVVSRIVGAREILVDQANWVPGRVMTAMSVIDASPANDWTNVKVIELQSGAHGRENPTYGFIYPRTPPANFAVAAATPVAHADTPPPQRPQVAVARADTPPPYQVAAARADTPPRPQVAAARADTPPRQPVVAAHADAPPPPRQEFAVVLVHQAAHAAPREHANMQADFHLPSPGTRFAQASSDTAFLRAAGKPDHKTLAVLY
jgi:hypothetical protein